MLSNKLMRPSQKHWTLINIKIHTNRISSLTTWLGEKKNQWNPLHNILWANIFFGERLAQCASLKCSTLDTKLQTEYTKAYSHISLNCECSQEVSNPSPSVSSWRIEPLNAKRKWPQMYEGYYVDTGRLMGHRSDPALQAIVYLLPAAPHFSLPHPV